MGVGAIVGSIAGGLISASSAKKASRAQERSAGKARDVQERMFQQTEENFAPYREAGGNAMAAYMSELGLGEAPEGYGGYEMSPMARYALETGLGQVDASAASRGGLYSGSTLEALEDKRRRVAGADTADYLNRLQGAASMGQAAAGQTAQAGQNYAGNMGNLYLQTGQAQAQGATNMGNAINQTIGGVAQGVGYMNNPMQMYGQSTLSRGLY